MDKLFDIELWKTMVEPMCICSFLSIISGLNTRNRSGSLLNILFSSIISGVGLAIVVHILFFNPILHKYATWEYSLLVVCGLGGESLLRRIISAIERVPVDKLILKILNKRG